MLIAKFFWGRNSDRKKYYWASWKNLSFPYDEEGIGKRNMKDVCKGIPIQTMVDVCKAFQFKQWWIFRSKQTLWGDFLKAKYCKRSNPVSKKRDNRESLTWKNLLINKPRVEQHIQWKLQAGNCSFWWDNWLGNGPLAHFTTSNNRFNNAKVANFWEDRRWSWSKLLEQELVSQLSNILTTEFSPPLASTRSGSMETQHTWWFQLFISWGRD